MIGESYAALVTAALKWWADPLGYQAWQRRRRLTALKDEVERAISEQRWGDLDALNAEYDELYREQRR